jgi:hypothetical protein
MPSAAEILANLRDVANGAVVVAALWHALLAAAGVALALGWRPSQRLAGRLLAAPLASVALVAIAFQNAFNAVVFALLAVTHFVLARQGSRDAVRVGSVSGTTAGLLMLGLGWIYPHFLADNGSWRYFYAAPAGVVPCATLYVVLGLALLGASPRAASTVLAAAGLFFGVFGVAVLGVRLDLGLVIGSLALGLQGVRRPLAARERPA